MAEDERTIDDRTVRMIGAMDEHTRNREQRRLPKAGRNNARRTAGPVDHRCF